MCEWTPSHLDGKGGAKRSGNGTDPPSDSFFEVKAPRVVLHFGCVDRMECLGWMKNIDDAVMKLVIRKRIRAQRRAEHRPEDVDKFLEPTRGNNLAYLSHKKGGEYKVTKKKKKKKKKLK